MKYFFVIGFLALLLLNACSPQEIAQENVQIQDDEFNEEQFMREALLDEWKAHATYEQVIVDFGEVRPFINVIRAEQKHIAALERLFVSKGYELPKQEQFDIESYESLQEACQVGVEAEIANAEIYERFFNYDLDDDTRTVFYNLQQASLQNHLPAFTRCS